MGLFGKKKKEEKERKEEESRSAEPIKDPRFAKGKSGPKETVGEETAPTSAVKLPKGEDAESYRVILKPIITEKGGLMEGYGKYLFRVAKEANKIEIKKAVEKLYKVRVSKIHVVSMPSKFRQVGKYEGRRPGFKKAIVTLKEGERIEMAK